MPVRVDDLRAMPARRSAASATRRALPVALGSVTIAILAVTGARAFEGPAPAQASPVNVARAAIPQPAIAPTATDDGERRFTGTVGNNLTVSLLAAGVPERQGREYVWLLGKAIN